MNSETAIMLRQCLLWEFENKFDVLCSRFSAVNCMSGFPLPLSNDDESKYELSPKGFLLPAMINLQRAKTIVWSKEIWNAAIRDADKVFPDVKVSIEEMGGLTEPNLWLFQGVSGKWMMDLNFRVDMCLDAILVIPVLDSFTNYCFFYPKNDRDCDAKGRAVHYVRSVGIIKSGNGADGFNSSICAALYFLGLKITTLEAHLPHNKAQIRRIRKEFGEIPDVRIVTLRKKEHNQSGDNGSVDWQHQWIVSGHWRKQWYPSTESHKPLYIQPYLKGPEDKPFMPIRKVIYKVVR